jgi:hypothetical protein
VAAPQGYSCFHQGFQKRLIIRRHFNKKIALSAIRLRNLKIIPLEMIAQNATLSAGGADVKKLSILLCLALVVTVAGCGPIIGQMMRATIGVKDFQVTQGSLKDLRPVKHLLVFAPFEKTDDAYFICRGEDEANLAQELQKEKLFTSEFFMERDYGKGPQTLASLRLKTPEEVQGQLKLTAAPDAILSGKILARDENIAPTYGMIQELKLHLDLYNLRTKKTVSVEIAVKELHQTTMTMIVSELKRRMEKNQ